MDRRSTFPLSAVTQNSNGFPITEATNRMVSYAVCMNGDIYSYEASGVPRGRGGLSQGAERGTSSKAIALTITFPNYWENAYLCRV